MTTKQVADALKVDERKVRKSKGQFRYHASYHFGFTKSAEPLVNHVKQHLPNAVIVDSGNHYHDFDGGAISGSVKDSFLWVKFKIGETK